MSQTSEFLPVGVADTLRGGSNSHYLQITSNLVTFLPVAIATPPAQSMSLSIGVNSQHSFQENPFQ